MYRSVQYKKIISERDCVMRYFVFTDMDRSCVFRITAEYLNFKMLFKFTQKLNVAFALGVPLFRQYFFAYCWTVSVGRA